ncbi:putative transcription factor GRF family [Helianthus anomalus]
MFLSFVSLPIFYVHCNGFLCQFSLKIMKLLCPCGNGILIGNVTRKGRNFGRPYYKCPGSDKENGIPDCDFYSFEDELKQCPCGRGYCRTVFPKGIKHWCCCGDGACSFFARIESTWQPPSSSNPPPHCQSPSSPSSRAPTQFQSSWSPPSSSTPPPHCQSPSSPSSRAPTRFQSSWSPSSSQEAHVLKKKNELLFQALQVSQSANVALVDFIKDFADFKLEDE